jgi:hypothetical protein
VVALLLAWAALGAPVQCDALKASQLLTEARIDESRAPFTHPELVPGLALASSRSDAELREALRELCSNGGELSLASTDRWETATWSAHTLLLTRNETLGCVLYQRTIAISVGLRPQAAPRYSLRSRLPAGHTPIGECTTGPRWHDEEVIAGLDGPTRLVLATVRTEEGIHRSEVLVRVATPEGWHEQLLMEPAPERLIGSGAGPVFTLTEQEGQLWIVAHGNRTGAPGDCSPIPGEIIWRWQGDTWDRHDGEEARNMLTTRGLWRLTSQDGWFLIVAQDDLDDRHLLEARVQKIRAKAPFDVHILPSAWYAELNPGFLIAAPHPYFSEEEAQAARQSWRRKTRSYVKQAWIAPDPCDAK